MSHSEKGRKGAIYSTKPPSKRGRELDHPREANSMPSPNLGQPSTYIPSHPHTSQNLSATTQLPTIEPGPVEPTKKQAEIRIKPQDLRQERAKPKRQGDVPPPQAAHSKGRPRYVIVMGPMGSGKTTFVAHASGEGWENVEHGLAPISNNSVRSICCNDPPVTFVDTPGFEDMEVSEVDGLQTIATWLKKHLKKGDLAGIIFLHRISDNRMSGSLVKNLRIFEAICGMDVMKNVVVATTMWKNVPEPTAWRRQQELEKVWFKDIVDRGCKLEAFRDSRDSAWTTVNNILNLDPCPNLLIQREMARGKKLEETTAGTVKKRGFWSKLAFWRKTS